MFDGLKLRKYDGDSEGLFEYLDSLPLKERKRMLTEAAKRFTVNDEEIYRYIYSQDDIDEFLRDDELKEKLKRMDVKTILKKYGSSQSALVFVLENASLPQFMELINEDFSLGTYYAGSDPEKLNVVMSISGLVKGYMYERTGMIPKNIRKYSQIVIDCMKDEIEIIRAYDYEDPLVDEYICGLLHTDSVYRVLYYYKGENPEILAAIKELILIDPENLQSVQNTSPKMNEFIVKLLLEQPSLIKYYNAHSAEVLNTLLANGYVPTYERLESDEMNRCTNYDLFKAAIKIDKRSIVFFDPEDNIDMYHEMIEIIQQDLSLLKYKSGYTSLISNMLSASRKLSDFTFYDIFKDLVISEKISLAEVPDLSFIFSFEDFEYKDRAILKHEAQKIRNDITYLKHYGQDFLYVFGYNEIIRAIYSHSFSDPKVIETFKQLFDELTWERRLTYIDDFKFAYKLLKEDPSFFKYLNFDEIYEEAKLKKAENLFMEYLAKDLSIIKYYNGQNSKFSEYYWAHGGEFNDDIISSMEISNEQFIKHKDSIIRFIQKYNSVDTEEIFECLKYINKMNDEFLKSFNYDFLKKPYIDVFRDDNNKLNFNLVRIIGRYKEIQELMIKQLSGMDDKGIDLFRRLIHDIDLDESILYSLISGVSAHKAIYDVALNNYDKVDNTVLNNLIYLLVLSPGTVRVSTIEDIINIEKKQDLKAKETILNQENSLNVVKNSILIEKYGFGLGYAADLVSKYATDLDYSEIELSESDKKIINILTALKYIMNETDKKKLVVSYLLTGKELEIDIKGSIYLETEIRKLYARVLNKSLTSTESMKELPKIEGCNSPVYTVSSEKNDYEFNVLLTALGAYSSFTKPKNYKDNWFRAKDTSHAFCTSLISNQMMGTAHMEYACLAFTDIPLENLLLAAPFDISSATGVQDIVHSHSKDRIEFLFPKAFINNTRHTHNEMVIDRLISEGKLKPSYVILMCDTIECTSKEDKSRRENAIQAANDFGIPLVVIERSKIREHEDSIINDMLDRIDKKDPEIDRLMYEVLLRFENNRAGCREYWNDKNVTNADAYKISSHILKTLEKLEKEHDYETLKRCSISLMKYVESEVLKKGRKGAYVGARELGFDIYAFKGKLESYLELTKDIEITNTSTKANEKTRVINKLITEYNIELVPATIKFISDYINNNGTNYTELVSLLEKEGMIKKVGEENGKQY